MELFFKKYFWIVHGVFILLLALIAARTTNLFVESAIAPLPNGLATRATARAISVELPAQLSIEKVARITGLPVPAPEPDVKEPSAPVVDLNAAPRTSSHAALSAPRSGARRNTVTRDRESMRSVR